MPAALKSSPAPQKAAPRSNPVVSCQVSPECQECIQEDQGPIDQIGRPSQSVIIRRILEAHYAVRIAEKKAPKLAGIEA